MTPLFDELLKGGAPAVRALIGRVETLDLDFKQKPRADKDVQRLIGKALSAFANSIGGMVVIGVDCRENADGVDEVIGFMPVAGLARFASQMRDWVVEAVMPRLADVRVEPLDEGGDCGFLLVAVERSERRPHRNEAGTKLYYRRTVSSSRPMEHYEVEDAFRRASVPELGTAVQIMGGSMTRTAGTVHASISIMISLSNIGRISARHCYVCSNQLPDMPMNERMRSEGIAVRRESTRAYFELEPGLIHPSTSRLMAGLMRRCTGTATATAEGLRMTEEDAKRLRSPVIIGYGCLDMPLRAEALGIDEVALGYAMPFAKVEIGP